MNQWVDPNGDTVPNDWAPGLPPNGEWQDGCGCAPPGGSASVDDIVITGKPGTITSVDNGLKRWALVLHDGTPAANFRLDRFDDSGALIDSPMTAERATGDVSFRDPVFLSRDPVEPMEASTKQYADEHGFDEAPIDNTTYGRDNATWVPLPQTYMPEAPNTTQLYSRFNSTWALDPIQVDAPNDGGTYARQNGAWTAAVTGGPFVPISGATMTGPLIMSGSNMIALNSPLTAGQSAILGQKSGLNRWQLMIGDYTTEGLNNVGSNFSLTAYSTTGGMLGTWLSIARADGTTNLNGSVVNVAGSMSINGVLFVNNVGNLYIPGGSSGQVLTTNGSGLLSWTTPSGGGGGGIPEAPTDGRNYARFNATWAPIVSFPEAPADGQYYARRSLSWQLVPSGIPDAPTDGAQYGRQSGAWTPISVSGGPPVTISDTPPLAPAVGALWWDSVGGQLYLWYQDQNSSQWVIANSGGVGPQGPAGATGPQGPAGPNTMPPGVTDGSNAAAGQIGEVISSVVSFPRTTVPANTTTVVTSIVLTPGDWDVSGSVGSFLNSEVATAITAGISNLAVDFVANAVNASLNVLRPVGGFVSAGVNYLTLNTCRVSVSVTTTYYLLCSVTTASLTSSASGVIWARRMR